MAHTLQEDPDEILEKIPEFYEDLQKMEYDLSELINAKEAL